MADPSSHKPRIVSGSHASRPKPGVLALSFMLGALVGAAAGLLAGRQGQPSWPPETDRINSLETETESLKREVAIAERARQVSENAMAELKQSLFELDQQLASQREEVSFYRRLLDAGGSVRGLAVHEFELTATPSARVFGYRLVLTQNLKKTSRVDGIVSLTVAGVADDRATRLGGADLGLSEAPRKFEFKYYQLLEGRLTLPAGFTPMEVLVQAQAEGSKRPVAQTFPWQVAAAAPPAP